MGNKKRKKPSGIVSAFAAVGGAVLMVTYSIAGQAVALKFVEFDENGKIAGFKSPVKNGITDVFNPNAPAEESGSLQDNSAQGTYQAQNGETPETLQNEEMPQTVETAEKNNNEEHSIEQKQRFTDNKSDSSESAPKNDTKSDTAQEETQSTDEQTEIPDETIPEETEQDSADTDENGVVKPSSVKRKTIDDAESVEQAKTASTVVSDVTAVVRAAMPCVVSITNEYMAYDYWYDEMVQDEASASGIIIGQNDDELLIVTNYHVVEDSLNLSVQFIDTSEVTGYIKGTDPDSDLAIVSVFIDDIADDTLDSVAIAVLGDSDTLEVGEPAIAIGNSLGYGQSVTTGVISALNREIFEEGDEYNQGSLIQTDAAINPGSSGGALLNSRGEVIGINSSKIADSVIEGMGYAIPISNAKPVIDELVKLETRKKADESERGFLGISGVDVSEYAAEDYGMPEGVFVKEVVKGSAAEKAGIIKGDIITELDGEAVKEMARLQSMLEYYTAGSETEVTIERFDSGEYHKETITATLGKKE